MHPEMGDFTNFDEAAQYLYDIMIEDKLPARPIEAIKQDLIQMTNEDISKVGFPLIPRYLGIYLSPEWFLRMVEGYAERAKILGWGKDKTTH